jgi:hypothetical protein
MKRTLIISAFIAITMSSCMSYSCPTYAKKTPKMIELEKQQQHDLLQLERSKNSI